MKKARTFVLLIAVVFFASFILAAQEAGAQTAKPRAEKKMSLTGEIAKAKHGYIIRSRRGNAPSEIFTILNADPKILDDFVKSGKTVPIEVRVVSGDNVRIEKIDGRKYGQTTK